MAVLWRCLMILLLCGPAWAAEPKEEPKPWEDPRIVNFKLVSWDEEQVLEFAMAHNPMILAQREVTQTYTPASSLKDRLKENTEWYTQVGAGGTEFQTGRMVAFTGLRVSIPLSSPKEERQFAEKLQQETARIEEIRNQVLTDMGQLRKYEADLIAAELERNFADGNYVMVEGRVKQGLEEAGALAAALQKLNTAVADTVKLRLLIIAQRQQLAQRAGDRWKDLLAYLSGKRKSLSRG